jgi:hypothetical protein
MAFVTIDPNTIKVGDPITRDLWLKLKNNFDDHELRINSLATSGGTVFIFNGDVSFVGFNISYPNIFYYKARQDFSVNDFRVQLFDKQGITSGNLVLDLQKSIDTNNANFSTILTTSLSINFASAADYSVSVGSINSSLNDILTDQVLRVKITNIPTGFSGSILLSIGAQ